MFGWLLGSATSSFTLCHRTGCSEKPAQHSFSVKDSIEISYLVDPGLWSVNQEKSAGPLVSPDGQSFLLVTQRGILLSNSLESTIWAFDWGRVSDFVANRSAVRPMPKIIASARATSNTPVITDLRWLEDSKGVAFLARKESRPQLYVAETTNGAVERVSSGDQYVTAYDARGHSIAYTTLNELHPSADSEGDLVDVTGQSIWALLWRDRPLADRDEPWLLHVPNTLHLLRNGTEVRQPFTFEGQPLRLFYPVLSVSPDERWMVTIAAVHRIPPKWAAYQPRFGYEELRLTPDNKAIFDPENDWQPSQVVLVDLRTGAATPLFDAPAGRSLFHTFVPTKLIWSQDSRRILISDTFLPLPNKDGAIDSIQARAPAIAIADIYKQETRPVLYSEQPPRNSRPARRITDVDWDSRSNEVYVSYASSDTTPLPFREVYRLGPSGWVLSGSTSAREHQDVELSVRQDLEHPPALYGRVSSDGKFRVVWDPNPQLKSIPIGKTSVYRWHDKDGNPRSGILVLPPDYIPGRCYPLVLQTHGYEPDKFFADGRYTTGSGGRALTSRNIIVLQMDQPEGNIDTPREGPFQTEGFKSAIKSLASDGMIDPRRVGVIGFSFTVFHVLYAITHEPELFAAASITDGNDLSYWLYLLWTDEPYAQKWAEATNGGVKPFGKEGLMKWAGSAPGFNLDRVQTPLLISCLEKGTLVATWDIYGGLRTLQKPVEMLWLKKEDAPHVLVEPHHRYLSQQTAVDWFDFWLNGHEDPVHGKADQYMRWRRLRRLENKPVSTKGASTGE